MQRILKPILREAFDTCPVKSPVKSPRTPVKSPSNPVKSPRSPVISPRVPVKFPLDPTALNIVWHVRSGDVCPHCDDPTYHHTIYRFIARSLSGSNLTEERGDLTDIRSQNLTLPYQNQSNPQSNLRPPQSNDHAFQSNHRAPQSNNWTWPLPHQNIIIHQRRFSSHIPHLFRHVPHVLLFNSEDMTRVVETMLHADILVDQSIPSNNNIPASHLDWLNHNHDPNPP